jgi:hypothetical protein
MDKKFAGGGFALGILAGVIFDGKLGPNRDCAINR